MKNKICSIIGLVLIMASAVVGFIYKSDVTAIISIATAFLGATLILLNVVKKMTEENKLPKWLIYVVCIGTAIGGCLCAIGGITEEIITTVVGAVIAITTVIVSIVTVSKAKKEVK